MLLCSMCHHIDSHRWEMETADEPGETADEAEELETPEFLVAESAEDVDLLTDGGDDA